MTQRAIAMSKGVQIAIIVACFAAGGYLIFNTLTKERPGSAEGARASYYICVDSKCAKEYSVEPGQDLGGRDAWICPDCGKEAVDAARCPACTRLHETQGHGRYQANCPHCGEKMPPLTEQIRGGG